MPDVKRVVARASIEELRQASTARLEEFLNSNVALMRERDELKRRLERKGAGAGWRVEREGKAREQRV